MPLYRDWPVVRVTLWHAVQPIWSNRPAPLRVPAVGGPGVGGADSRMNIANWTASPENSAAPAPISGVMLVASSGSLLKRHAGSLLRGFPNSSLVTPCSTL